MNIKTITGKAVLTTSIEELNGREMRQMYEMRKRIETVLKSHKNKDEKKQYLNDDELELIHAILYVFTKHMGDSLESEFNKVIEQLNAVEQASSFSVVMYGYNQDAKVKLVKVIKETLDMSLVETASLFKANLPFTICKGLSLELANELAESLRQYKAIVQIKPDESDCQDPEPEPKSDSTEF